LKLQGSGKTSCVRSRDQNLRDHSHTQARIYVLPPRLLDIHPIVSFTFAQHTFPLKIERYAMKKLLIVSVSLLFLSTPSSAADKKNTVVSAAEGSVTLKPDQKTAWDPVDVGHLLVAMDNVKTGQESRAELKSPSGITRLYQNPIITIPELYDTEDGARDFRILNVEEGTGIFKIKRRGRKNRFTVTTKHVSVLVKGTTFAVKKVGSYTVVACIAGKVLVEARDKGVTDKVIMLNPGHVVVFSEGAGFEDKQEHTPCTFQYTWNFWKKKYELEVEGKVL
jgi:hypothetical protein